MERIGTEIENRLYRLMDAEGGHTKSATYGIPCLLFFFFLPIQEFHVYGLV